MLNLIRVLAPAGKASTQRFLVTPYIRFFSEDISSTFKSRSKLTEFYKFTHPDILSNAPEKVREENLRSIKLLNSYLDSLGNNSGVTEHHLKFYIAEKSTNKNKKFYLFEVTLSPLKPSVSKELLEKHTQSVISYLLKSLEDTRVNTNPMLKQEAIKEAKKKTDNWSIFQEEDDEIDMYKMGPMNKKNTYADEFFVKPLQNMMMEHNIDMMQYDQMKKDLKTKITDRIYDMTGTTFGSGQVSRLMEQDMNKYLDYFGSYAFNPKYVFIAEGLSNSETSMFFESIMLRKVEGPESSQKFKELKDLSELLIANDPPIYILVSKHYSATEIPGFISVPFNFKFEELIEFITNNIAKVIEQREEYFDNLKRAEELCTSIQNVSFFYKIELSKKLKANNKTLDSSILCLKRLQKFFGKGGIPASFRERFRQYILNIDEDFNYDRFSLTIPSNFKDLALFEFLKNVK